MSGARRFLPPITPGYRIFVSFEPAGLRKYRENFDRFYDASLQRFELVSEPSNAYDKNAIMVIGVSSAGRHHIGYLDRETAKQIAVTGLIDELIPRIDRIYRSADGYIEARFQLLGPKEEYSKFVGYVENLPPTKEQKDVAKFYDLSLKGLSRKEATKVIQEFEQQNEAAEDDWITYSSILDMLDDREFRSDYEIKKPKKADLEAAFETLKCRGYSYTAIEDDIDLLIDELKLIQNSGGRRGLFETREFEGFRNAKSPDAKRDWLRRSNSSESTMPNLMIGLPGTLKANSESRKWTPSSPPTDVKPIDTSHMRQRHDEIEDTMEKIRREMMERKRTNNTFFILAVIIVVLVVAVKILQ